MTGLRIYTFCHWVSLCYEPIQKEEKKLKKKCLRYLVRVSRAFDDKKLTVVICEISNAVHSYCGVSFDALAQHRPAKHT
jgi:hypothetical protein